jgi:hypothetical protein
LTKTSFLELNKPDLTDPRDITVLNENSDLIDTWAQNLLTADEIGLFSYGRTLAATAFPSQNLHDGMQCFDFSSNTVYTYNLSTTTWSPGSPLTPQESSKISIKNMLDGTDIDGVSMLDEYVTALYKNSAWVFLIVPTAGLVSPDFTGTPTVPDLTDTSPGNQIANKSYVDEKIIDAGGITVGGTDLVNFESPLSGLYFYMDPYPTNFPAFKKMYVGVQVGEHDLLKKSSIQIPDLPNTNYYAVGATTEHHLIVGILGNSTTSMNTVMVYDETFTITTLGKLRANFAATSLNGRAFFSEDKISSSENPRGLVYDDSLTTTSFTFTSMRENGSAQALGSYVIFTGGQTTSSNYSSADNTIDESLTVTSTGNASYSRNMSTVIGNTMLICGGEYSSGDYRKIVNYYTDGLTYGSADSLTYFSARGISGDSDECTAAHVDDYALVGFYGYTSADTSVTSNYNHYFLDAYSDTLTKISVENMGNNTGKRYNSASIGPFAFYSGYDGTSNLAMLYDSSLTKLENPPPVSRTGVSRTTATFGKYALYFSSTLVDAYELVHLDAGSRAFLVYEAPTT